MAIDYYKDTRIRLAVLGCHRKNGPGKNGPAGPNLDEKMVWPDHYWLTKIGPAGPILVTKVVWADQKLSGSRDQH